MSTVSTTVSVNAITVGKHRSGNQSEVHWNGELGNWENVFESRYSGKGSPAIYVNGREVRDINELAQINSADIKNVEVVTNPGAKID